MNIPTLANWLKEAVQDLIDDPYIDGLYTLADSNTNLCYCVFWEGGWGEDERDDIIQDKTNPDYGIVTAIKVKGSNYEGIEYWPYPYDDFTGDIFESGGGVAPDDDYEALAADLIDSYNNLKEYRFLDNGELDTNYTNATLTTDDIPDA